MKKPMEEENKNSKGDEPELVHLNTDSNIPNCEKSFITELQHCKETRFKLTKSLFVALAFMILGWTKGQLGPAFLDLLFITGVDLKTGSGFMTSYYAGRMVGSVFAGVIYSKVNKYLIFVISISVNGIIVAAIPRCFQYELMVGAHIIHGISGGVLDVAITSEAITIWGPTARGRSYLQILSASFAISGLLAPFATAPFLLQPHADHSTNQSFIDSSKVTSGYENSTTGLFLDVGNHSSVDQRRSHVNQQESRLYIAFFLSSGIAFLVVIPFIVLFFKSGPSGAKRRRKNELEFIGNLPILVKWLQVINMGIFSSAITGVDFTFGGYLSAFCVQYLNWTKTAAAMLTSVVFCSTLVGRLGGIFIVHRFKSNTLMLFASLTCIVGFVAMFVSACVKFNIGIWLSVGLIGIPFGIVWPVFLSWVNENVIPIYGKVTSYLLVTSFCGAMVNPVLIGYLMENVSLLWFCYLCFIQSVIATICVIFMIIHTRCMINYNDGHKDAVTG